MDVLSEVLKVIKLEAAIYYNAEFSAPWSFRSPPSRLLAPYFERGGGHVIIDHLLIEGQCLAGVEDGERIAISAGDVVIFPHGDAHIMSNGRPTQTVDSERELHKVLAHAIRSSAVRCWRDCRRCLKL